MFNKLEQYRKKESKIDEKLTGVLTISLISLVVWFYGLYFFSDRLPQRLLDSVLILSIVAFIISIAISVVGAKWEYLTNQEIKIMDQESQLRVEIRNRRHNAEFISPENAAELYGIQPKEKQNKTKSNIVQIPKH